MRSAITVATIVRMELSRRKNILSMRKAVRSKLVTDESFSYLADQVTKKISFVVNLEQLFCFRNYVMYVISNRKNMQLLKLMQKDDIITFILIYITPCAPVLSAAAAFMQ